MPILAHILASLCVQLAAAHTVLVDLLEYSFEMKAGNFGLESNYYTYNWCVFYKHGHIFCLCRTQKIAINLLRWTPDAQDNFVTILKRKKILQIKFIEPGKFCWSQIFLLQDRPGPEGNLSCMLLICETKLEYHEKTHTSTRSTCKLHRDPWSESGIKLRGFFLWGISANHWVVLLSEISGNKEIKDPYEHFTTLWGLPQ